MRVLQSENSKKTQVIFHKYDQKILALLCNNIRLPLSKIAQRLRLSRQSVEYRLKVMERAHLIEGSRTVINIRKLGYQSYHYFLSLANESAEQKLLGRAQQSEHVNALVNYSGKLNYELSIMAKIPHEAQTNYVELIHDLPILESASCIILETFKADVLPQLTKELPPPMKYIRNDPSFSKQFTLPPQTCAPDAHDLKILYFLSQDALQSLASLAHRTHLHRDVIAYRIKKLIRSGYILQFRPVINFDALSYSVQALLIKAKRDPKNDPAFKAVIRQNDRVLWATELFGTWDYLFYLLDHTQEEIHETLTALRKQFPDYIQSYEILFAYKQHKYAFMTEAMMVFQK